MNIPLIVWWSMHISKIYGLMVAILLIINYNWRKNILWINEEVYDLDDEIINMFKVIKKRWF